VNDRDFATRRLEMESVKLGECCIERQCTTTQGNVATFFIALVMSVPNSTGR
jgi:hypothetical protein